MGGKFPPLRALDKTLERRGERERERGADRERERGVEREPLKTKRKSTTTTESM